MIKKTFIFAIIFLIANNIFAQTYFKIEGTKRIFTFYGKKQSTQINDSITVFYFVKNSNFYLAVKPKKEILGRYIKYDILNKKEKAKIKSIQRGINEIERVRFICVNLIKTEDVGTDSKLIEKLLKVHD